MAKKKNLKGLASDMKEIDQLPETYPFAKNGIQMDVKGAQINEPGFIKSPAVVPYTTIGIIPTDTRAIFFSTNGTSSAIGWYDEATDTYQNIIDDTNLPWKMKFRLDKYITGQYQKNHKGEYEVAFTDKWNNPRVINCNDPQVNKPEDLLLFMRSTAPDVAVTVESGGEVLVGSHYVSIKYSKSDGAETPFISTSAPVSVSTSTGTETSDKAIRITLTNVDISYQFVIVAIISKIKGVTSAVQLDPIPITPTMSILFTGNNRVQPITLDEVLVAPAIYTRVGTIGQLNDELWIGNLEQGANIEYQRYASMIQVRVKSKLIDLNSVPNSHLSGAERGHMHQEGYALYLRWKLTDGTTSSAFTIAGPAPQAGDEDVITVGGVTGKKFQLQDTNRMVNFSDKSCSTGVWINQDELYPMHPQFDSTSIGGEDLRGTPVRHHRMPSLRFCKNNFYQTEGNYMKDKLDILGLEISNVIVPPELVDRVSGYEILYAKRSVGNQLVMGQSAMIYGSQNIHGQGAPSNVVSTGGNWRSQVERYYMYPDSYPQDELIPQTGQYSTRVRLHPFDMLFNNPTIPANSYLSAQNRMRVNNIGNTTISWGVDLNIKRSDRVGNDSIASAYLVDYAGGNAVQQGISGGEVMKINKINYAPSNVNTGEWNNTRLEKSVVMTLGVVPPAINISFQIIPVGGGSGGNYTAMGMIEFRKALHVQFEETMLANLMVLRNNIYDTFYSQSLVATGQTFPASQSVSGTVYAGDTFVGLYTFHTYGWNDSQDRAGDKDQDRGGTKVIRRIAVESVSNINARYEVPGNIYSQFWPKTGISFPDIGSYIMQYQRSQDPNQFGYSRDLNAVNDIGDSQPYNPFSQQITKFPYRVARSGKFKREGLNRSWRTFLPLDYYEMPKNMGEIINLEGMDDRLLIHHENTLFVTQDKAKLESSTIDVTLGSGDIFQFTPQEALSSKLGYAGTQHDLACIKTPIGYMFVDAKQGQIFLYKGTLQLMNNGLNLFFRDYARLKENNPFLGNGITIGYDSKYKRLLLTVKNRTLGENTDNLVPNWEPTPEFIATLTPGVSIVYKDGRYQLFLGVNSNPDYSCPELPPAEIVCQSAVTIADDRDPADVVAFITSPGTSNENSPKIFSIIAGNTDGAFTIDPMTGYITISNGSALLSNDSFTLTVQVTDGLGQTATCTQVINVTHPNRPPVLGDYDILIDDDTAIGTEILQIVGFDPDGDTLTYEFVGAHPDFNMSTDGKVTVSATLNYDVISSYTYPIRTFDGEFYADATLTIRLANVNNPPTAEDQEVTILDTHASGTLVWDIIPAVDPDAEEPVNSLDYTLVSGPVGTIFELELFDQTSPDFLKLKLIDNSVLDPLVTPQYNIVIRATDYGNPSKSVDFTVTVNVLYDPALLTCEPGDFECEAGVIIPDFDFLVARYYWLPGAGTDLDTLTGFVNVPMVPSVQNNWVGWSQGYTVPGDAASPPATVDPTQYLQSAGDNTGTGAESVIISAAKFVTDNPSVPNIVKLEMRAFWYGTRGTGDAQFELVAYKGGAMVKSGFEFTNPTGTEVFRETFTKNVTFNLQSSSPATSTLLGTIEYNKTTLEARLIQE